MEIALIFSTFIITVLSIGLGVYIGLKRSVTEDISAVGDAVKKSVDMGRVGVIKAPTQSDLLRMREEKENPKIAEGKREFKKFLDTLNIFKKK
jgi:hypothetical protein